METVTLVHPSGARMTCRAQAARVWKKSGWTEPVEPVSDPIPPWGLSPIVDEDDTF